MSDTPRKNPVRAVLLSLFPGGGQFYYGNVFRGLVYLVTIMFALFMTFALIASYSDMFILTAPLVLLLYVISLVDTVNVGFTRLQQQNKAQNESGDALAVNHTYAADQERFYTILLSFIPGLGHFQLGLMTRGLTFMTVFFGAAIMVFFVTFLLHQEALLLFLLFLPVVWVYSFFDAVQMLNKKQGGETLQDRSFLEDLEKHREEGRKSKAIATLLAIFPGAGHLYLGYQKRGIQLMAIFLFSLYILDSLRLGLFLFLIPMIWFYSFFDGLQKASLPVHQEVEDKPVIPMLLQYQRWLGLGLIFLGILFFLDRVLIPSIGRTVLEHFQVDIRGWYYNYFQITLVSLLMIVGGIRLLMGFKSKNNKINNHMREGEQ